jgi:hypothetical protein
MKQLVHGDVSFLLLLSAQRPVVLTGLADGFGAAQVEQGLGSVAGIAPRPGGARGP